ncbi:predicted protein [Sclerotinia sclerotiorum 1980 UF-70]|uniref:Uncharacterized protein n=1 Tax=Sclerotinia sclerotiorum (strain ATCC 18683 / 1980 / Ss-1) TaxID=665079 RepID=A7EC12_SCLS1|nr:predicted protein [Sclerotinia sclerotiorum 1980 UF-70]EDN99990.1 predicted protein [Sclerotinia sclerotiorum 1980 UF-70]
MECHPLKNPDRQVGSSTEDNAPAAYRFQTMGFNKAQWDVD